MQPHYKTYTGDGSGTRRWYYGFVQGEQCILWETPGTGPGGQAWYWFTRAFGGTHESKYLTVPPGLNAEPAVVTWGTQFGLFFIEFPGAYNLLGSTYHFFVWNHDNELLTDGLTTFFNGADGGRYIGDGFHLGQFIPTNQPTSIDPLTGLPVAYTPVFIYMRAVPPLGPAQFISASAMKTDHHDGANWEPPHYPSPNAAGIFCDETFHQNFHYSEFSDFDAPWHVVDNQGLPRPAYVTQATPPGNTLPPSFYEGRDGLQINPGGFTASGLYNSPGVEYHWMTFSAMFVGLGDPFENFTFKVTMWAGAPVSGINGAPCPYFGSIGQVASHFELPNGVKQGWPYGNEGVQVPPSGPVGPPGGLYEPAESGLLTFFGDRLIDENRFVFHRYFIDISLNVTPGIYGYYFGFDDPIGPSFSHVWVSHPAGQESDVYLPNLDRDLKGSTDAPTVFTVESPGQIE